MRPHTCFASGVLVAFVALTATGVRATGDKVAFPENYAKGVLYWVQDRPANKQVREYYTSREAIEAARKGQPLPSNTVITVVQYNVRLDAAGNPVTGANARFIKTDIRGYTAMEKRSGWGAEYPDNIRNGEWEYQSFNADRTANAEANLTACFTCHKKQEKMDFVFSYENIKTAAN
jgi:Cytochrome P460